jgi:hypothetical protein
MLERDVEIRKHKPFSHEAYDLVDVGVGVDVVQPDPGAELSKLFRQIKKPSPNSAIPPHALCVLQVDAVGAGVLGDDEELLHAGLHELLRLAQHLGGRAAHEIAPELRDDAERTAVIAALGNLQVRVMARCELDPLRRHEVEKWVVLRRRSLVHGGQHALVLLRSRDGQDLWEALADRFGLRTHAAGDDHSAVLGHCLPDRAERLGLRGIEKAAGVDDDDVGPVVTLRELVSLSTQLRDDALGIDQRLRAPERNERDLGCSSVHNGPEVLNPGISRSRHPRITARRAERSAIRRSRNRPACRSRALPSGTRRRRRLRRAGHATFRPHKEMGSGGRR